MGEMEWYLIYREPQPLRASVEDMILYDECKRNRVVGC